MQQNTLKKPMPTHPLRCLVLSVASLFGTQSRLTTYNTRLVLRRPIAEGFNRTFRQLHPALRSFTVLYAPEPDFMARALAAPICEICKSRFESLVASLMPCTAYSVSEK